MGYFDKHRRVSTPRTATRAVSFCQLYGPRLGWASQAGIGPLSKAHVVPVAPHSFVARTEPSKLRIIDIGFAKT